MKPVALCSMPTLSPHIPSFTLGILKPTLERAAISVDPFSFFLPFAKMIGWELAFQLSLVGDAMAGEWIWSKAAFGDFADDAAYLRRFDHEVSALMDRAGGFKPARLKQIKNKDAPKFIDWAVAQADWSKYGFVGFTVVFQQLLASVAMAKAIKQRHPKVPIVFGGATFEDDIAYELMRQCDFIDAVHCGDADETLPELARRLDAGESLEGLPGVLFREGKQLRYAGRAPNLKQLEKVPAPDYDDFFSLAHSLGIEGWDNAPTIMLPIETARGCWYGMKNHCTFCGLNRQGMEFRHKPAPQVLEMLKTLSRRYGSTHFNAIDNILAPEYVEKLFGQLKAEHTDLKLHYEIRPTVNRDKLKLMREGGLFSVQPGVESFSTHVLTLMKKFTTGVKNLELIKWTTYYGIDNLYNILYGFYGETEQDYVEQARLIRKIPHFHAPYAMAQARPDRGSPMYERREEHGIVKMMPASCYPWLFPERFDLNKISYYFEDERVGVPARKTYEECIGLVAEWRQSWAAPSRRRMLTYTKGYDTVTVHDQRTAEGKTHRFDDKGARLLDALSDARRHEDLVAQFDGDSQWLDGQLNEFEEKDLAVHLDGKWLGLALPQNPFH
jgi:ribosomal peptide maturation radical SAM protein 1